MHQDRGHHISIAHLLVCLYLASESQGFVAQVGDLKGIVGLLLVMVFKAFQSAFPGSSNHQLERTSMGNTAVVFHHNRLLALQEVCPTFEF